MPCENCSVQFTVFKRKKACASCHRLYCSNCFAKIKKQFCRRCSIFETQPAPSKEILLGLKTKDLIFYLQSKKINFTGICEKEELANLIINHINNANYEATSASNTPNNDFENYTQSFDQIKAQCQSLFNSISDKISQDFQKTTCFNQQAQNRQPTTTQPRSSRTNSATPSASAHRPQDLSSPHQEASSSSTQTIPSPLSGSIPPQRHPQKPECAVDCACCDDEMDEISEKRQSIFEGGLPGPSGCSGSQVKIKVSNSESTDSSSFEELETNAVKTSDENWQFIEKTSTNGIETVEKPPHQLSIDDMSSCPSPNQSQEPSIAMTRSIINRNPGVQQLTRRRSDSSLLGLRKSNSITIDTSAFDASQSGEVKKLRISCNKCGKAKSNIKTEVLKLSEQLRSSNRSEAEINAKIKEFLDYLESRSQPSEMTETENSQLLTNQNDGNMTDGLRPSTSHDEIGESIFDENEGINVYSSAEQDPQSSTGTPRRFLQLDDIHSSQDLESLSVKQLKEILMLNRVDFKGCCEKQELKERVERLYKDHIAAPPSDKLPTDDLCKICMDAAIECVFLECGHSLSCVSCGKVLNECPICRQFITRIVRIFKS